MVVIRLQRRGTKKKPDHRIIVAERTRAQRGRILETVGYYNPAYDPPRLRLEESRIQSWVSTGAQISPAVAHLVKLHKRLHAS